MNAWKKGALLAALLVILALLPLAEAEDAPSAEKGPEEAAIEIAAQAAEITPEEAALTVTAPGNKKILAAGKDMQFTASFAAADKINAEAGNDAVQWSIRKEDGSEVSSSQAKISAKGKLTTTNKVKKALNLVITAASEAFGTQAEYRLLVYPKVTKLTIKPSSPLIFLGNEPGVIQVATVPAGLEKTVTWSIGNKKLAKLQRNEEGALIVTPLKAGSTTLTAKSAGGATARVMLKISPALKSLKIVGDSFVRKGERLQLSFRASPKNTLVKQVSWGLDVGPEIATIDSKGRLKPASGCPVGTVVTVSCWPKGADKSKSIVATKEIVVTYARVYLTRNR